NRVGLYGISRGAEHALLLATLMVRDGVPGLPDAIAVHTPPDVICAITPRCGATPAIPDGDPGTQQSGHGPGADRRTNSYQQPRSLKHELGARAFVVRTIANLFPSAAAEKPPRYRSSPGYYGQARPR